MHRILFVCLGNICRSPLAEGIMLHLKEKYDLPLHIDSAGTAGYHIGEPPDPRTVANARRNGVDLSSLRARQFQPSDFHAFDRILVMDRSNMRNVLSLAASENDRKKVALFLDVLEPGGNREVPDPYYGTEDGFEEVYQLVYRACEKLAQEHLPKQAQ
jgi:protein-tyrosine phosphatase